MQHTHRGDVDACQAIIDSLSNRRRLRRRKEEKKKVKTLPYTSNDVRIRVVIEEKTKSKRINNTVYYLPLTWNAHTHALMHTHGHTHKHKHTIVVIGREFVTANAL